MYYQLSFKTGKYIVERLDDNENTLIQVLAVIFHPKQGDLHHPKEVDVFFHERKALAFKEKRYVSVNLLKPYKEQLPDYATSLKEAVIRLEEKLHEVNTPFNEMSLKNLSLLKEEYTRDYKIQF